MFYRNFIVLTVIIITVSCNKTIQENNCLTNKEIQDGWELLFDGETTDKWRLFKGNEVIGWNINNGVLCNSGIGSDYGGDIITKDKYTDFELYLEWRIDSLSNSGVFYLVNEFDSIQAIYESGPEYQLSDDTNDIDPNTLYSQLTGSNYAMYPARNAIVKPLSEWNTTRIIKKGVYVEHWLNEIKVVEYELWSEDWIRRKNISKWKDYPYYGIAKDGHIGLQDHGGLTFFRNIKIRRL